MILIAVRFVLHFLAVLSILLTLLFSLSPLGPLSENFQVCRSGLILASSTSSSGSVARIMWSVIITHCWCAGVKFRYAFSHISSIASFLAWMFRIFRPPSFMGHCRVSGAILGLDSCPQMNLLIVFSSTFSMGFSIPCALVFFFFFDSRLLSLASRLPDNVVRY